MRAPPVLVGLLLATAGAAYAFGSAEAGAGPRGPLAAEDPAPEAPADAPAAPPPMLRAGGLPRPAPPPVLEVGTAPPPPSGSAPGTPREAPSRRVLVTVSIVDATTGRVVPGARWTSRALPKPPAPPSPRDAADAAPAEVESVPPSFENGASALLARAGDRVASLYLGIDPRHAPGYAEVGLPGHLIPVSRYASTLSVVWPVVPEADIVVEFTVGGAVPPTWMDFGGVELSATVAGAWCSSSGERVAGGVRVHGIPALRGAPVRLEADVRSDDGGRGGTIEGVIGPDPSRPLRWKLDLPAIATACGASSGFIFSPGCRRDGALWRERPWTGKTGSVVFTVTRRDGRPAADALVLAYPTGDDADARDGDWSGFVRSDGRLRLDGVPIGTYTLRLDEAGLVASETPFEVVADTVTSVAAVEAPAASIDVLVVHEDGAPAAGAVLEVTPAAGTWAELGDDDVQHVAPHTGPDGRRHVTGLPSGATTVRATYAGRRVEATVEVATGATERLTLTVPAK